MSHRDSFAWCALLGCCRHPGESIRWPEYQSSHADDFLRVASEMRHGVEDGPEAAAFETLNSANAGELFCVNFREHACCFLDNFMKSMLQLVSGNGPLFLKLGGAVANIRDAADTGDNPLPNIAAQMENQVANAVELGSSAMPDLIVRKLIQTMIHAIECTRHFLGCFGPDEASQFVCRHD